MVKQKKTVAERLKSLFKKREEPKSKSLAPLAPTSMEDPNLGQKQFLLSRCMEGLCAKIPEHAQFALHCDYPGTNNEAYLWIVPDEVNPALRRLTTRVVRQGTDVCRMHYIAKGTPEEMQAYLSDPANMPELLKSWQELSDATDHGD